MLKYPKLILGSNSPRRREILADLNIPFECAVSDFDERSVIFDGDPAKYVQNIACAKADTLKRDFFDEIVITADTAVYYNGQIFNKPDNISLAAEMLQQLQGSEHTVLTGITASYRGSTICRVEKTNVTLTPLTAGQIECYQRHIAPLDKAGAYTVQGMGSLIVAKVDGCFYNVLGLPLVCLKDLLAQFDWNIWEQITG